MTTVPMRSPGRGRALLAVAFDSGHEHPPGRSRPCRRPWTTLAWVLYHLLRGGKLFGWFNGPGFHQTALVHVQHGHTSIPAGCSLALGGVIELGGGLAMALGLAATRLAGLALFGDMVMAMITVTWSTGINSQTAPPGYQLKPSALAVLALVMAVIGAGRFSIDAFLERRLAPVENSHAGRAERWHAVAVGS